VDAQNPGPAVNSISPDLLLRLDAAARQASARAYAPYSKFRVGAACVAGSGTIYSGVNVENASYGLTICAERNALFQAVAAGERDIRAMVVYTPTAALTTPCGACRQVLCEFGNDIEVICCCDGVERRRFTSGELLPERFRL
jgi:cytidine deaminase